MLAQIERAIPTEALLAGLAGLAAFAAIVSILWPYLRPDRKVARLRRFREERDRVRLRGRAALFARKAADASARPSIIDRTLTRLRKPRSPGASPMLGLVKTLRHAGYRDPSAVTVYVTAQILAPILFVLLFVAWARLVADEVPGSMTLIAGIMTCVVLGSFAPRIYVQNQLTKRRTAIVKAWPDTLDLMLICVESGMTVEAALARVAEEMAGGATELASELNLTTAELSYLQDRSAALRNLGVRTGIDSVRSVVSALIQSEKYGTSLAASLRVIAQEQRDQRLIEAEKKAASLPPKLTVPMILFFLPALFVVILAPAAIRFMQN